MPVMKRPIDSLYEISLEIVSQNSRSYDTDSLFQIPKSVLINLIDYLTVRDLERLQLSFKLNNIDLNPFFKLHFLTVWSINNQNDIGKGDQTWLQLYFEHLFSTTRASKLDLSVAIDEQTRLHILDLTIHLIKKHQITKNSIEYRPLTCLSRCKRVQQAWNPKWNVYIKRLNLTQTIWNGISTNRSIQRDFLENLKNLTLAGYPQTSDIKSLRFIVKLLVYGNIEHLTLKFPNKCLLKIVCELLSSVDKQEVNFGLVSNVQDHVSFREEMTKQNLLINYQQAINECLNEDECSDLMRQKSSSNLNLVDEERSRRLNKKFSSESCVSKTSIRNSTQSGAVINSDLFTIHEEQFRHVPCLFKAPKFNKIANLQTLEIFFLHKIVNINLLNSTLPYMRYLENLSISYVNLYSADFEATLLSLILNNRLKSLSLRNMKLSHGAAGFLYKILTTTSKTIRIESIRLETIRSQSDEFVCNIDKEFAHTHDIKKLIWKENQFTAVNMDVLNYLLETSKSLNILDLKSLQQCEHIERCMAALLINSDKLEELCFRNFLFVKTQPIDQLLSILRLNQLKSLKIENAQLYLNELQNDQFGQALNECTNLEWLSFYDNHLNCQTLLKITNILNNWNVCKLKQIDIRNNHFTFPVLKNLIHMINERNADRRCNLGKLRFNGNNLSQSEIIELRALCKNLPNYID